MAIICPTITVETKEDYDRQLKNVSAFAHRIHIDVADGTLAPRKLLAISELSWPTKLRADIHIMVKEPSAAVEAAAAHKPNLIIFHAEASGDFMDIASKLHLNGIKVGVALLQQTTPAAIMPVVHLIDHVLIFSGNLGYQGGSFADIALLNKVKWLKQVKPNLEIGWDGGVNDLNIASLADGGVDVINVGGYIQRASDPKHAYAKLKSVLGK